ncbi:MAG: hypothetical protein E3J78_04045 [Candidatus Cloacimonadota bacterium]|nr:MAG: hypothetical protein E3J78_04045 [Candidatus Cloacimonadota bacterium]
MKEEKESTKEVIHEIVRLILVLSFALLLAMVSSLRAIAINGRSSTSFYGYQEDVKHSELYQKLDFDLLELGTQKLSIHSYTQISKDISANDDIETKIRNAYFNWKENALDIRVGRQFISRGIGRASIDGLMVQYQQSGAFSITGYAGTESPFDSVDVRSWSDGNTIGSYVSLDCFKNSFIGVSWVRKERNNECDRHAIGFDTDSRVSVIRLYSQGEMNILEGEVNKILAGIGYRASRKAQLYTEYRYSKPAFRKSSVFNEFEINSAQQLRVGINCVCIELLRISGEYSLLNKSAVSHRVHGEISSRNISIGYIYGSGYGGSENSVIVNMKLAIANRFRLGAGARYSKYSLSERLHVSDESITTHINCSYRFMRNWDLSARVENYKNKHYEYDTRVVINTTILFHQHK